MSLVSHKIDAPLSGTVAVPGDKSMSHRALMLGGLAVGETVISGLLEGEDVLCTAAAMRCLGAEVEKDTGGLWHVYGTGIGGLREPDQVLDMGNSGTSTRLLAGLIAAHPITAFLTGDESLRKRPMKRITDPLEKVGASFMCRSGARLPLGIAGAFDPLSIEYELPVASAQVKSAILFAGLNSVGQTTVIEHKPTRDHTEHMLRHFGVGVDVTPIENGSWAVSVTGHQDLQPCVIDIPGDPSSAAFPIVAAVLSPGSHIVISSVGINDRRVGLYSTLREMGAEIRFENERQQAGELVADLVVEGSALSGVSVPADRVPSMIDEFPVLAMAAACANGKTIMTGLAELRVKESDRLLMVAEGLKACGVALEMGEDSLIIHGTGKPPKGGALIETALDHRIAMSFLVLGSVTEEPVRVDDAGPIETSFPAFSTLMNDIGLNIQPFENL